MFNHSETHVLLIKKNRPEWQKGMFNGIGGKLKDGESSLKAMIREFKEETGITQQNWDYVITMKGDDWAVDVFTCKSYSVFHFKQMTDEKVYLIALEDFNKRLFISNLYWLIPMCLDAPEINYSLSNTA